MMELDRKDAREHQEQEQPAVTGTALVPYESHDIGLANFEDHQAISVRSEPIHLSLAERFEGDGRLARSGLTSVSQVGEAAESLGGKAAGGLAGGAAIALGGLAAVETAMDLIKSNQTTGSIHEYQPGGSSPSGQNASGQAILAALNKIAGTRSRM
jgi:hypothetical protein